MLNYLKIFSWFLFTFGVVGLAAVAFGADLNIANRPKAAGLMALQITASSLILVGFRLNRAEKLSRKMLLYGGWSSILFLIVLGQVWLNLGE